jgi:hypothetical protein
VLQLELPAAPEERDVLVANVVEVLSGSDDTSKRRLFPSPRTLSSERPTLTERRSPDMPKLARTLVVHWSRVSTVTSAPPGTGRAESSPG